MPLTPSAWKEPVLICLSSRLIRLGAAAALSLGAAFFAWHTGALAPANAQEPSPTPTRTATPAATGTVAATPRATEAPAVAATPFPECEGAIRGGQTIAAVSGASVTLPSGEEYDLFINPPGAAEPTFTVCHADSQARVTINALTCREVSESVPDASGALIIARIVESCTTTASAGSTAVATQVSGNTIAPPNTGDGGLR
jgi:hypothetical protein